MYTGDYDDYESEHEPHGNACIDSSDENEEGRTADSINRMFSEMLISESVDLLGNQLQFVETEENTANIALEAPVAPSPPESTVTASLFENVNVNSIGDYYGIDKLVSLANTKINRLVQSNSEDQSWVASIPSAIDIAVQLTGDDELLGILASATAANISSLLGSDQFTSLGVLTDFSIKVLHNCAQEIRILAGQRDENKLQLRNAEEQIQQGKLDISALRGCLETLNKTSHCRHCATEFQCFIDPSERLLRCAKCRCKHYN